MGPKIFCYIISLLCLCLSMIIVGVMEMAVNQDEKMLKQWLYPYYLTLQGISLLTFGIFSLNFDSEELNNSYRIAKFLFRGFGIILFLVTFLAMPIMGAIVVLGKLWIQISILKF